MITYFSYKVKIKWVDFQELRNLMLKLLKSLKWLVLSDGNVENRWHVCALYKGVKTAEI